MTDDQSFSDLSYIERFLPKIEPLPKSVKRYAPNALPDFDAAVKEFSITKNTNRARLAKVLGMSSPTLTGMIKGRNPRIELLLALSEALQVNLFDLYLRLLPEHLRATTETRQLQEQLDQMTKEKDALEAKLTNAERERELVLSLMRGREK